MAACLNPRSGAPDELEILAVGMASLVEECADMAPEHRFLGDLDGRFVAQMLFGKASDADLDAIKHTSGMIVNFKRGKGEVFDPGTRKWVAGLVRHDAMFERVTCNVLNRYLGRR